MKLLMISAWKLFIRLLHTTFSKELWQMVGEYTGMRKSVYNEPIRTVANLQLFICSRSSHVAQTALYGYMKTRAGTRFPEMFKDPGMLKSINMAKWHIYLDCLSDLSVYIGAVIHLRTGANNETITQLMSGIIGTVSSQIGSPKEAGPEFSKAVESLNTRIKNVDYTSIPDNELAFSNSPQALYQWSPIADEIKIRDKGIVKNSIRFRWKDVRTSVRALLDAETLMATAQSDQEK